MGSQGDSRIRLTYNSEETQRKAYIPARRPLNDSQSQGSSSAASNPASVAGHLGHGSVGGLSLARSRSGGAAS
jgi:hypothetical protein